MPNDTRTYIKVHDGLPDHPKVEALSDRAFRLLVETWCWCSRQLTDGEIPMKTWTKRGTAKARRELVDAGLVEEEGSVVRMHDYLEHQRSADEVAAMKRSRSKRGSAGNHRRWHIGSDGRPSADCDLCQEQYPWLSEPELVANGSQVPIAKGSQQRSQQRSPTDRQRIAEAEESLTGLPGQAEGGHPGNEPSSWHSGHQEAAAEPSLRSGSLPSNPADHSESVVSTQVKSVGESRPRAGEDLTS